MGGAVRLHISSIAFTSIVVLVLGLGLLLPQATSVAQSQPPNPIVLENQKPGDWSWEYVDGGKQADDTNKQIKGYASSTSVNKGGSIDFKVTVTPAQTFTIKVWRMGYYSGTGGRLMQTIGPLSAVTQPVCPVNATTGLIECNWSTSYTLAVPQDWTTGIYLAQLINAQKYFNYIIFVVRDDSRVADLLYQQPVMTYQAYNYYPNDGKSVYDTTSFGPNTIAGTPRAVRVSFDRPYIDSGLGLFGTGDYGWEPYFIHWLEKSGYDVSYSTNLDTHENGARLLKYKAWLTVGHDEYWTAQMYDNVASARDQGTDLGFFSANNVYWHVRLDPSSSGTQNRIMTVYKDATIDPEPVFNNKTILFRDQGRAEQQLVGVQYVSWNTPDKNTALIVTNSNHWVYAGSGLSNGSSIARLVGYEADALMPSYPSPVSTSYTTLASSPFVDIDGKSLTQQASVYVAPSGACVFGAGTFSWSWGLDRAGLINPGIQQATKNILDAFINACGTRGGQTPTETPVPTAESTSTATVWPTQTSAPTATPSLTPTGLPDQGPNVLINPGFEDGALNGWTPQGTVSVVPTSARTGSFGASIQGQSARIDQVFNTVAGQTYTAAGWIRLDAEHPGATWGGVRLEVVDAAWRPIATSALLNPAGSPFGQWVPLSITFVATGNSARILVENFSDGAYSFSADDLVVSNQASGAATPTPTPVWSTATSTSISPPTPTPTGPTPTPSGTPVQGPNVLINGGFEEGTLNGWTPQGSVSIVPTSARTGSYGVSIQGQSARIDQVFSTVAGKTYAVTGWLRLDAQQTAATWGGTRLEVVNASWKTLATSASLTPSGAPFGQWVPLSITFVAPDSSARILVENFSNGAYTFSADDIVVSN